MSSLCIAWLSWCAVDRRVRTSVGDGVPLYVSAGESLGHCWSPRTQRRALAGGASKSLVFEDPRDVEDFGVGWHSRLGTAKTDVCLGPGATADEPVKFFLHGLLPQRPRGVIHGVFDIAGFPPQVSRGFVGHEGVCVL